MHQRPSRPGGAEVPAPNFDDLDDEETVTYDARRTPAVSLPALRAECVDALSDDDFEFVPATRSEPVESNIHRIEGDEISDDLVPPESNIRASRPSQVAAGPVLRRPSNKEERVSAAAFLTKSRWTPPEPRKVRPSVSAPRSGRQTGAPALVHDRPSISHSLAARFLLVMILAAVLMFVAMEVSVAKDLPWLDPRHFLGTLWKLIADKIPWQSLPKLPKF
jgi:hypothetical protein